MSTVLCDSVGDPLEVFVGRVARDVCLFFGPYVSFEKQEALGFLHNSVKNARERTKISDGTDLISRREAWGW